MMLYTLNGAVGVTLIYLIVIREGVQSRRAAIGALAIGIASVWFSLLKGLIRGGARHNPDPGYLPPNRQPSVDSLA
jgi:hypothetical protein